MKRIHIVGSSPRTGTTLMLEAMKVCFNIDCFSNHEERLFNRPDINCNIYLTKCPKDILIVGPSLKVDKDLYIVCMIRDPRDIVCSKHNSDPDKYWASLRFWNTYTEYARRLSNHPRFIMIKYEDFATNTDSVQRNLMNRMPFLEKEASFSQYHEVAAPSESSQKALGGVRPIKPVSVGKWREHRERVAGQIEMHGPITDDLIEFGYEEDDTWLRELEGIPPDKSPSHWPEYMTEEELRSRKRGRYLEAFIRALERIGIIGPYLIKHTWLKRLKDWLKFLLRQFRSEANGALERVGLKSTIKSIFGY